MSKIYTKKGDLGFTNINGEKKHKSEPIVQALGDLDMAMSLIGWASTASGSMPWATRMRKKLNAICAEISGFSSQDLICEDDILDLERIIDSLTEEKSQGFVLCEGDEYTVRLHVSRCAIRQAERSVAVLSLKEQVRPEVLVYLNRASDFVFAIATCNY